MEIQEIADINSFLTQFSGLDNIIYCANYGNAGDSLITLGAHQLFKKNNIKYGLMDLGKDVVHNKVIFYGGGGNLVNYYYDCRGFLERNMNNNNKIIILPHTVNAHEDIIKKFNKDIVVFCREKISYEFVYQHIPHKENVYLSKDMAFYVDLTKYQNSGNGTLNCFRLDAEKTNISIPTDNIDLSADQSILQGYWHMIDPIKVEQIADRLLKRISEYKNVNTNRLHIGLMATLLGKDVRLHPNSYWKNEAIYDYSLKSYPNITFEK